MGLKKIVSYIVAIFLGLLAVAPPIPYPCDIELNSLKWVYMIVASALLAFFLFFRKINAGVKIILIYLFFNCFLSQVPSLSFTAYCVAVWIALFYLLCLWIDYQPILEVIEAVFWLQVALALIQHFGYDTLLSFGRPDKTVFFGTVFQQMRLGSLFAIMSPFLILKDKRYIIPLVIVALSLGTLGFTFALAGGIAVYAFCTINGWKEKLCFILWAALLCVVASDTNNHIAIELKEGRWPIWKVIFRTWYENTLVNFHGFHSPLNPSVQTGPFDWTRFLFGHGINTFNTMFPFYKYDPGAFRPAHNDWLQTPWEIGLIGAAIFDAVCVWLVWVVYKKQDFLCLAGLVIIAINRFLAFPDHMWQTVLMMVAWVAICQRPFTLTKRGIYGKH